jgi:hypothetical protein
MVDLLVNTLFSIAVQIAEVTSRRRTCSSKLSSEEFGYKTKTIKVRGFGPQLYRPSDRRCQRS